MRIVNNTIIAIDQSLRKSGVVIYADNKIHTLTIIEPAKRLAGGKRLLDITNALESLIIAHNPTQAVLEGYSYGIPGPALTGLTELGGCIRMLLARYNIPVIVVPPSSLKKFATGKGNAKKSDMIVAANCRWDKDVLDDNIADALCLVDYALCVLDKLKFASNKVSVEVSQ